MAKMQRVIKGLGLAVLAAVTLAMGSGCDKIDNKAIPNYAVRIDLGSYALWNTYGVSGLGEYRIFNRDKKLPSNFPYNVNTYTGYGGVLLMMCLNTTTGSPEPMAYDLSCPVEASQSITLTIDDDNFDAVCSKCGSHYDELQGMGGPRSGVAINSKLGLRTYRCTASNGGYVIAN